jgi:hypothetical protein
MGVIRASKSAVIPAPPPLVYSLIADYRQGHPRILPLRYFGRLEVEQGGVGAGTIIRYEIKLFGREREVRAEITEPRPGVELVETDFATGARTTFTVAPGARAGETVVTIQTEWETGGLRGWIEAWLAPRLLQRIYVEELAQLAAVAAADAAASKRDHDEPV